GGNGGSGGSGGTPSNCVPNGRARNPIVSHIFTADPSANVFNNRVYVYTSHDSDGQTGFDLIDYHAYSSDDMVNWQDHGVIIRAADVSWATNLYAPGACEKNGKYYLYMPNSGSGIGVAVADDPGGPFVDPLGHALVTKSTPGVGDVDWLFDPACFVDDDGQAYLYFGGGPSGTGDNARVMRLNNDMISLKDTTATTIPAPAFFEASFMHKRNSIYYFSYSTDFEGHSAYLDYMTSNDPMTGFQHRGTILTNGNINMNNNNHGSIIEFMGQWYLFYHNRKLELDRGGNNSYQRSVAVQKLTYMGDAIQQMSMSTDDFTVEQLKCLDGFSEVQAETMAAERGIEVEGNGATGVSVVDIDTGDWIGYSQVDFRDGATTFVARVASASGGGSIEVRIDGCDDFTDQPGTAIGTCDVTSTGGNNAFTQISCPITETSGPHDLCLKFTGNKSFRFDSFHLE
ncbi:MAG: glycoside hydrolase family 43 protein, partial [Gammaproteobacteria bacterium]